MCTGGAGDPLVVRTKVGVGVTLMVSVETAWSVVVRRSVRVVVETIVIVRAGGTAVFVVVIVRVGVGGVCVVVRTMVVEVRLGLVRVGLATVVECVVCVCAAEESQSLCRALKGCGPAAARATNVLATRRESSYFMIMARERTSDLDSDSEGAQGGDDRGRREACM